MLDAVVDHDVGSATLALRAAATLPDVVAARHGLRHAAAGRQRTSCFAPHALTGSSRVAEWWGGLVGPGALFDPARWCVVGINTLGGCYGSTGPSTLAPDGRRWGPRFPVVTVEDMVDVQRRALLRARHRAAWGS